MKTGGVATVLVLVMAPAALCQTNPTTGGAKVPDSITAMNFAEKILAKRYGKGLIESERPFTATLSGGVWHIAGTLHCKDKKGNAITNACVGGVAMADIRQSDGRVLRTGHTM
jgi:NTF2 fold immunity protein